MDISRDSPEPSKTVLHHSRLKCVVFLGCQANELHERLFLEPHMLDRRVSQPEVRILGMAIGDFQGTTCVQSNKGNLQKVIEDDAC